jgi:hypothetical protein
VDRLCVPGGGALLARILQECHDTPLGGHFGRHKTAALVCRLAYWPGRHARLNLIDAHVTRSQNGRVMSAKAPRQTMWDRTVCPTRFLFRRAGVE